MLALTNLFCCLQGLLSCTPLVVDFVGVGSEGHSRGLAHEGVIIESLMLEGLVLAVRWALQGVVLGGLALGRFGACNQADVCLTVDACCFSLSLEGLMLEGLMIVVRLP